MPAINNEWIFAVTGGSHRLRHLSQSAHGYDVMMYEEAGDHDTLTGDFRMKTWFCNGEDRAPVSLSIAKEAISLLNGGLMIVDLNHETIHVTGVYLGEAYQYVPPDEQFVVTFKALPVANQRYLDQHIDEINTSLPFQWLHLSKQHDDIYLLLKYFSLELNWVVLYKIWETIEHFTTAQNLVINYTDAQRRSFKGSANNFTVAGIQSRHGPNMNGHLKAAMTLVQARQFISEIALDFLTQKITALNAITG